MELGDQAPVSPVYTPAPPAVNPVEPIQSLPGEKPLSLGRWRDGRSSRAPQYSARYNEYKRSLEDKASLVLLDEFRTNELALVAEPLEPQSYDQAVASDCPEKWMAAFKEEFDSLEKNNTWKLVEKLPPGYTAINCKWIGKIKPGYEGVPERYKGRLVAVGCRQKFGRDYDEVFSPVAHQEAVKATLAEVAFRGLYAKQIDIKTAFLYSELDKKIFMKQPQGFLKVGKESWVCELQKSIYGLKQAPRLWYQLLDRVLGTFSHKGKHLVKSNADKCVYVLRNQNFILIVIAHVDDLFMAATTMEALDALAKHVFERFEGRTVPPTRFLGTDITRDLINKKIHLSQQHLVVKLIDRFDMKNLSPKFVPADPSKKLIRCMLASDSFNFPYREAVGALLYLAISTRPDISYAVGQVAKHCQNPDLSHWEAVEQIFAYLITTQDYGLWLGGDEENAIVGYCDADFAGDINDRTSTSGNIFFLHGGPVAWSSKKQKCVALSTTEAEYVSASEATKTAVWLRTLHNDFTGINYKVPLFCDNQGAVRLVHNPEFHPRTKHVDNRYHFVRKMDEDGLIEVLFVKSENQLADIFTKPLPRTSFEKNREKIGVGKM